MRPISGDMASKRGYGFVLKHERVRGALESRDAEKATAKTPRHQGTVRLPWSEDLGEMSADAMEGDPVTDSFR